MLKVAWRNLWRHRTRTWITIAAIAITYALYLVMMGIQDFTYRQMEDAAAQAAGGAVVIQAEGFQDSQMNDRIISDGDAALRAVESVPSVEKTARRVIVNGLLSTSASSSPARLQGVDPEDQLVFQDLREYVTAGTFLEEGTDDPLVLGVEVAEELELALGDRVVLTVTAPDGEMQRALFHLTGILDTGSSLTNRGLAFTSVEAARSSVGLEKSLTQIGLLGSGTPEELKAEIETALAGIDGVEVLTWAEAMPDIVGFIEMDKAYGNVLAIVLFLVVLFAIMNTFLMAVMERVRELGLLRALGLTPFKIALLVLNETLFLTIVALAIGFVAGLGGHLAIDQFGIDMAVFYGDSLELGGIALTDTIIYSELDVGRWLNASVSVLVMVLFSAAYPAYKAARLAPAEAMRFYE